jgi:hypothetical protein
VNPGLCCWAVLACAAGLCWLVASYGSSQLLIILMAVKSWARHSHAHQTITMLIGPEE